MKLSIDSDKKGYVRLPTGVILETSSGVINTTYTGVTGNIEYYLPNPNSVSEVSNSGLQGNLILNGTPSGLLEISGNLITGITAATATRLETANSPLLTSIVAPKINYLDASGCALTEMAIGELILGAYENGSDDGYLNMSGGTSKGAAFVDVYLLANRGVSLLYLQTELIARGFTILLN